MTEIMYLLNKTFKTIRHPKLVWQHIKPWVIRPRRMIFLFGSPGHSNLGDQAQTYLIQRWFKENYPDYGIKIFTLATATDKLLCDLKKFIRRNDKIICHSGYHFTDLYHECDVYKKLAISFPHRKIIIFPQTICYNDLNELIKTANIFNSHGNTTLMCRDEVSYKTAQEYFYNCKLMLMPDIVTSLIGTMTFNEKRNGILFCVRNDCEAFYSKTDIKNLQNRLTKYRVETTDTTLPVPWKEIAADRGSFLMQEIKKYSTFQAIITDRYHGTIISLIANTPVIVIGTQDHKLSSGVRWFPKDFNSYIAFAENLDKAYDKIIEILNRPHPTNKLSAYFKEEYYDKLKEKLNE